MVLLVLQRRIYGVVCVAKVENWCCWCGKGGDMVLLVWQRWRYVVVNMGKVEVWCC